MEFLYLISSNMVRLVLIIIIVGLIKPNWVMLWKKLENQSRLEVLKYFGTAFVVLFLSTTFLYNRTVVDEDKINVIEMFTQDEENIVKDNNSDEKEKNIEPDEEILQSYNEIIETIENKNYITADKDINHFLKLYPDSIYTNELNELKLTIKPEIEIQEKLNHKTTQTLIKNGIKEKIAINYFDIINENKIPIWGSNDMIIIESDNDNDFIFSYTAIDGGFSDFYAIHVLNDNIIEIVNSNMEIIYNTDGLNPDYIFFKDIDFTGLINATKDNISRVLKAPNTAKYPGGWLNPYEDWSIAKEKDLVQLSSYVDSQNSFGANIRSYFTIRYRKDNTTYKGVYFEFDGKVLTNKQ